jgi:hypothetical protein
MYITTSIKQYFILVVAILWQLLAILVVQGQMGSALDMWIWCSDFVDSYVPSL